VAAPHALPAGPLVNYGYEGEVLLLTDIKVPQDARAGDTLTLGAKAEWLVCKETCIPEDAQLELALPVAERSDLYPQWGSAIGATRDAIPAAAPGWLFAARADGPKVVVTLTARRAPPRQPASTSSPIRKGRSRRPASSRSFAIRTGRSC
jgi:thiol:disulfide interchange protein DsbD